MAYGRFRRRAPYRNSASKSGFRSGYKRYGRGAYTRRLSKRRGQRSIAPRQSLSASVPRLAWTKVPDACLVKLIYKTTQPFSFTSAGLINNYQFRGNSLFDPDFSFGGNQPLMYDQLCAFWQQYVVYACSIQVKIIPVSTNGAPSNTSFRAILWPTINSTIGSTLDDNAMQPFAIDRLSTANSSTTIMKGYMGTAKVFGYPKSTVSADQSGNFLTATTLNPNKPWFWNFQMQMADTASVFTSGQAKFMIEYTLMYYSKMCYKQSIGAS